jgi:hypothetical protein
MRIKYKANFTKGVNSVKKNGNITEVFISFLMLFMVCFSIYNVSAVENGPIYTSMVYPGINGKLVYKPDSLGNTIPDFSCAGYCGGGVEPPYVPVKKTVWPVEGDSAPQIQAAIDSVSKLTPDSYGFRGAILLKHGYYRLLSPLKISSSGIVLRGEGQNEIGTILIGEGKSEGGYNNNSTANLISVIGESCWKIDETTSRRIIDAYVPVGTRQFIVEGKHRFASGDRVLVRRNGNKEWIKEIGMNQENPEWRWEPFTITFDRIVTAVDGNKITVDAPITCAIETKWGGGDIVRYSAPGRISKVGIENLRGVSSFDPTNRTTGHSNMDRGPYIGEEYYSDENHYWNFIVLDNAENLWVRNVTALHFAGSLVSVRKGAKWITIQDCNSLNPVSIRGGGRRFTYQIIGQLTLVQRCKSDEGRHSFVLGDYTACGPNVFLDCEATVPFSSSEPHYKFVTGALYDNVRAPLTLRYWKEISIGWEGANCVLWNCEGPFLVQKPPTAQNYAFGHIGIHSVSFNAQFQDYTKENGYIESWDKHVSPRSLYLTQLRDRLGEQAVENISRQK